MPQTRHPAFVLFFVLLVIWLILPTPEFESQSLFSDLIAERLSRYRDAHTVLNSTRWGDFAPGQTLKDGEGEGRTSEHEARYINLTGFREEDGLAWEDLGRFRDRGRQLSRHAVPPVGGQWLWEVAQGEALWQDTSGTLLGDWVRRPGTVNRTFDSYNLTQSVPSMEWAGLRGGWARNTTASTGRMLVRLEGNKTVARYPQITPDQAAPLAGGVIRDIRGSVTIEEEGSKGLSWEMRLWGVHWPRQGVIIMTTTSEKFEGIFGLPHLTPGPDYFESSQWLLDQVLGRVVADKEKDMYADHRKPWNSDVESPLYTVNPSPRCEYILYAQVHPPDLQDVEPPLSKGDTTADVISAIESELESPQGAPIHGVPKLQLSTVLYSPDCAFFLESKGQPEFAQADAKHLVGMKTEYHIHQVKTWLLVYALVVFGQVYLLKNQMKETFTPSTLGRVSFETISIMVLVDCLAFTAATTWISSAAATFLPTLAIMPAAFLSLTMGGSLLVKIHEVQAPTRARRQAEQGSSSDDANGNASSGSSAPLTPERGAATAPILPAPVTAGRGLPAPLVPELPDPSADAGLVDGASAAAAGRPAPGVPPLQAQTLQSIVGRLLLMGAAVSLLLISSTTWYASIRSWFMNLCAFTYLSLWVPQIYRNVIRNCRRALKWQFVVGQSVLRLLPIAYFWVKPDNFLYARTEGRAFAALTAWVWLQILVLATQDAVGPRFGIPAGWTPDAWDYHPVLREDSVEAGGLPIGLFEESAGLHVEDKGGVRAVDCAICREVLEVPVAKAGEEDVGVTSVFARRMYMVTPCRHIFHTTCLEGWMRFRLQCPICREELPPL